MLMFQLRFKPVEGEHPLTQIDQTIEEFKRACLREVRGDNEEPISEKLYGESQYDFPIPEVESIYVEKRLYSLTYEFESEDSKREREHLLDEQKRLKEENASQEELERISEEIAMLQDDSLKKYDMNFYMDGENLVCEFARIF